MSLAGRLNNLRQVRAPGAAGVIGIVGALARTIGGSHHGTQVTRRSLVGISPDHPGSETKQRSAGLYGQRGVDGWLTWLTLMIAITHLSTGWSLKGAWDLVSAAWRFGRFQIGSVGSHG